MATSNTNGQPTLTEKQQQVYDLIREGKKPSEAATILGLRGSAVHSHIDRLKKKGVLDKSGKPKQGATPVATSPVDISGTGTEGARASWGRHARAASNGVTVEEHFAASRDSLSATLSVLDETERGYIERLDTIAIERKALDDEVTTIEQARARLSEQREHVGTAIAALGKPSESTPEPVAA